MKNKKIAIDFDGAYVNTGYLVRRVFESEQGIVIPPSCLYKNVASSGVGEQDFESTLKRLCEDDCYLSQLQQQPNAGESIAQLSRENFVRIITGREGRELLFAQRYLEKDGLSHLLELNPEGKDKNELAAGFEIFVDDIPSRLVKLSEVVPRVVVFNTYDNLPSNLPVQERTHLEKLERISDWKEFLDFE